jgi:transposase-like protein
MSATKPVNDQFDPDLLSDKPKRWTAQRKAAVVEAIRRKIITVWDACERYDLSAEELAQWERNLDQFGVSGLQMKQVNRKTSKPK